MFLAKNIIPQECETIENDNPSNYGRNFAASGGVANAVIEVAKEKELGEVSHILANGGKECKLQLQLMKQGKFTADILEGMCCIGGCLAGPAIIEPANKAKARMMKENITNQNRTVLEAVKENSFEEVDLEV